MEKISIRKLNPTDSSCQEGLSFQPLNPSWPGQVQVYKSINWVGFGSLCNSYFGCYLKKQQRFLWGNFLFFILKE